MLQRLPAILLTSVLLGALVGCASGGLEVSTTYDPLAQFPAQATFAWDEAANHLPSDERIAALDFGPRLKAAAEAEFAARGYRLATAGDPDFLLNYQLLVHSRIAADKTTSVASLSLLLKETASGRRVWVGFGHTEIHVQSPQHERDGRLRRAVAEILGEFPPGS